MKCVVCGTPFPTWEGDHGSAHGRCPTCGMGYGSYSTNETKMESWENERKLNGPTYLVHTKYEDGRQRYSRPYYGPLEDLVDDVLDGSPGRTISIFNRRTGKAVERFTVIDHWLYRFVRTEQDKQWLVAHGGVIG